MEVRLTLSQFFLINSISVLKLLDLNWFRKSKYSYILTAETLLIDKKITSLAQK